MILNSSIKIAIMQKYKKLYSEYSKEEVLATEVLFYKYLLSFMSNNPEKENEINNLISAYGDEFKLKFVSLKNNATSYQNIINFINTNEFENLLSMREDDINQIYYLYATGVQIVQFDPWNFNTSMYGVGDITNNEYNFLYKVHTKYMVPIYNYLHAIYGIQPTDFKIVSANEIIGNAGKVIYFSSDSIQISNIYSAIINKRIPIYNFECELEYPNIKLIIL